jgi:hypothetical protein
VKIEKKNKSLDEFLKDLDLNNLGKDLMFSDCDDDESGGDDNGVGSNSEKYDQNKY